MSGEDAPSQPTLFSLPIPLPPAATPTIAAPAIRTNASDGPSSSSNTSSFSGTESEDEGNIETSRKRKRKRNVGDEGPDESRKMMSFFQSLIQKVMDQQEKMLQRFLDAIERREHNRMVREEAWRRQEKTRISREREFAAHERSAAASRDDAIVSFLQKLTGQNIPFPPPPQPPLTTAALAEETMCSPPISPLPPPPENTVQASKETTLGAETTILSSRWPKAEVLALIKLRSEMESRYQESIPKGPLWEEISTAMLGLGYNRSAKRCKEKWENINKYYKKVKESNKNRREDTKTCPYFHQLDALYRNKLVGGSLSGGAAPQILSIDDQLAIVSPTAAASGRQQDDLLGFFEQGSSSVSPVKKVFLLVLMIVFGFLKSINSALFILKPEDIVKKEKDGSFLLRVQCMMPIVLSGGTGQNNLLAMVR